MYEIPKPQLLDPKRVDRDDREDFYVHDHRSQAELVTKALTETCGYADQLWEQLNALRGYLLDSLPPDPRTAAPDAAVSASPIGPEDEQGWQHWIDAFAGTTSVLCGTHGDSGFGLSRARDEARLRHLAPARHAAGAAADGQQTLGPDIAAERAQVAAGDVDPSEALDQPARADGPAAGAKHTWSPLKTAGATAVTLLALRGLRPRPRAPRPTRP